MLTGYIHICTYTINNTVIHTVSSILLPKLKDSLYKTDLQELTLKKERPNTYVLNTPLK